MIKAQVSQEFGISPMPTPDPSRPGCRVMVSLADFSFAEIPAIGTTLVSSGLNITKQNNTWLNHVFAGVVDGPRGFIYFLFNPPLADSTIPFRSYNTSEDYPWPAVLKDLGVVTKTLFDSPSFEAGATPGDGYATDFDSARFAFTEGRNLATSVLVEEFLSSEPFDEEFLAGDEPFPTPIDGKFMNGRISFPACLHPEIEIPVEFPFSTYSGYVSAYSFVDLIVGNSTLDIATPYKVSRTNFLNWADFTPPTTVKITESNLYYAIKRTYRVPNIRLFSTQ